MKYVSTCRICGMQFQASAMPPPDPTEKEPPEKIARYVMAFTDHLSKNHAEAMVKIGKAIQNFSGLIITNIFAITDPALLARSDDIRHAIHEDTRKHFVSDANIADLVSRLGLDSEHEQAVNILMREMRNAFEEIGDWSPQKKREIASLAM